MVHPHQQYQLSQMPNYHQMISPIPIMMPNANQVPQQQPQSNPVSYVPPSQPSASISQFPANQNQFGAPMSKFPLHPPPAFNHFYQNSPSSSTATANTTQNQIQQNNSLNRKGSLLNNHVNTQMLAQNLSHLNLINQSSSMSNSNTGTGATQAAFLRHTPPLGKGKTKDNRFHASGANNPLYTKTAKPKSQYQNQYAPWVSCYYILVLLDREIFILAYRLFYCQKKTFF